MQEPDPPAPEAVSPPTFYVPGTFRSDQSVGYLMRNVLRSIRDHANQRLAAHDLTYVQWLPLYKLAKNEGNTVAGLARELEIDAGAMTRAMDRLEAKGLVRRERSVEDRRVVLLALTPEGRKVARRVPAVLSDVLNGHLDGFSVAEWEQLQALLRRMVVNGQALRETDR